MFLSWKSFSQQGPHSKLIITDIQEVFDDDSPDNIKKNNKGNGKNPGFNQKPDS